MFAVTESFVKRGEFSTDQMWTFFGTKSIAAPDDEVYSKYGYGTSLFAAPFYALALLLPFSGLMQVSLLSSAMATALTGAVVYLAARRLNFSASVAVIVALLFGLATPAWVYAKEFWSEPFAALTLFAAFYFLLCYRDEKNLRDVLFAGILLGLAIAVRTTNVLLVPWYVACAFLPRDFSWIRNPRLKKGEGEKKVDWWALLFFSAPIIFFVVSVFLYNWIRFQNPLTTGYRADEDFSNNILLGAYGLLFSPGKGLFVYAPFLAALPYGVWQFYKHQKRELIFILILATCHLILFSAWYYWWGGTNWAARFLVPTLPFLVLLCAPLVKLLFESRNRVTFLVSRFSFFVLRFTFAILVLISFINALAGVVVNSLTYRLRVLNVSANADWDSIFLPALSPLIGHWQTLRATNFDVAWVRATPDTTEIDWLVVTLTGAFVLFCAWLLIQALRGKIFSRIVSFGAIVIAMALVIFSLARYADDPRLAGNEGYAELVQTLPQITRADDVLVLNDDAHARFFFNANRARLKWYGLSRDPARWDEATRAIFSRKLAAYERVWFVYDENVDAPNPMRDWFEANLRETERFEFTNDVTLVLYVTRRAK